MLGAIIGDMAGSVYEFDQFDKCHPVKIEGDLITKDSFFTDDTILTVAILEAILEAGPNDMPSYEYYLKEYGRKFLDYNPDTRAPHFVGPFSSVFAHWIYDQKYKHGYSNGNGAMMRISPVAYLFNDFDKVKQNAFRATMTSHDSCEAVFCVQTLVQAIFLARQGLSRYEIADQLDIKLDYRIYDKFNSRCNDTIDNCLAVALSATSFEDAIRTIISLGGDTDTNACIVGSIAEALFGIPEKLKKQALEKLPADFVKILDRGYDRIIKLA